MAGLSSQRPVAQWLSVRHFLAGNSNKDRYDAEEQKPKRKLSLHFFLSSKSSVQAALGRSPMKESPYRHYSAKCPKRSWNGDSAQKHRNLSQIYRPRKMAPKSHGSLFQAHGRFDDAALVVSRSLSCKFTRANPKLTLETWRALPLWTACDKPPPVREAQSLTGPCFALATALPLCLIDLDLGT